MFGLWVDFPLVTMVRFYEVQRVDFGLGHNGGRSAEGRMNQEQNVQRKAMVAI